MSKKIFSAQLRSRVAGQSGFALVELIIAVSIMALLGVYAASELTKRSQENLAEGAGTYIKAVSAATEELLILNFLGYEAGDPVAGVAVPLQPTVAELVTLGLLNPGFPSGPGSVPTRQTLRLDILRQNCPGPACSLTALACTTTPVTLGGADTRFDLASTMVTVQGGSGGQSQQNAGGMIRGPTLNVPNPVPGSPEGIVCGGSAINTALFNRFVRLNDTRDPSLQGPLTVQGPVALAGATTITGPTTINNNTTVAGTLSAGGDTAVGTCARILATTGRAGFGCADPDDVPAGYAGGVRSPDVVASGRILASDAPGAFTGTNTNYVFAGVEGGVAEVRTSGRAAADRLTPLGSYVPGSACALDDTGSIARNALASGLVYCQDGAWVDMVKTAAAGSACGPDGSMATASSGVRLLCVGGVFVPMSDIVRSGTWNEVCPAEGLTAIERTVGVGTLNETLICRANPAGLMPTGGGGGPPAPGGGVSLRYMRLHEITSNLSFVDAVEASDGEWVSHPNCRAGAAPIIQLIGKGYSSPDGGVDIYAESSPGGWTVRLRNGAQAPLAGSPEASAIAQVFCYFP